MSYLRLEKAVMTNLQESLRRELLRTNRSGAYSSSTLVDCNTRKYHGLLVVPVPELDDENHVLLSSLDCTVIQHGAEFNLGLHKYQGNNFSPNGHKYIREFDASLVPTTTYRVGGVVLKKEVIFQHYEDRILIRYTLVEAHSATTLRFRPFLAFRSVRQFTHENSTASREYTPVDNGIKTCMYAGYPDLFMQFSKKNEFIFQLKKLFDEEVADRVPRDNFYHCLVTAAHQFHFRDRRSGTMEKIDKKDERYLLAGYPWFKARARDTFIALPGLTLAIGERDYFELVMRTAERGLREFMEEKPLSVKIYEIEQPDVPLWAIWAIQQYVKDAGKDEGYQRYGKLASDIVDYIIKGGHPNLRLDENGLLFSNGRDRAVTWMNSTANGRPVVPRSGYIVEFNALWYNALKFCASMAAEKGDTQRAEDLEKRAELAKQSFVDTFVNEYGYLLDYVDGNMMDWSVRPNMIFAVALDYSPLNQQQMKNVVDICTRELLTPKGLRSLSPKSGGYNPIYVGPQTQRDYAYHQGTAWPWLGGFYMEACLKLYKRSRLSFIERQLVGYEDEMDYHAIGTISELFDGNPPFHGRGAMSFAMNVAEILRTLKLMDKYSYQK